ncbi:PREDICTED: AT-rich interactive domain-containing protein 3A-like [Nanorana parkeri]|uniref:AT-rich interactive domain-containing protein 3A-like n=1 Tax=Nanorana parkeri TaxID=125878 RepID=UPI000854FB46|nr:PREDICTED: AT-rich interactive domain-containing protein 3A-like [Nanorana parkeri]
MKLQAVMETLQRQQRARLQQEMEARQLQQDPVGAPPDGGYPANGTDDTEPEALKIQRAQAAALAAMRAAAAGLSQQPSPAASEDDEEEDEGESMPSEDERERDGESEHYQEMGSEDEELKGKWDEDDFEDEEDYEDMEDGVDVGEAGRSTKGSVLPPKHPVQQALPTRPSVGAERPGLPQNAHPQIQDHGDWTYEEQFKQLYELDGDPKRKEFLDDLFSFMQKRGTPVNRIPIMAKQVLDLYMLYVLVTEKGGLVEVINKKLWREITKGLNLPTSITSAAFTLRTQYMKYLYPYECEKRGLSNPNELQAAIDSNRREGRRQSFGGNLFTYSPSGAPSMLSSPKMQVSAMALGGIATNGSSLTSIQKLKKEEESPLSLTVPSRIPVNLTGHSMVAAQMAAQAAALEQLREKLESGEPPEKKLALGSEEQQRLVQRAIQQNLLAMTSQFPMNIRINSQAEGRHDSAVNLTTNGTNSISMSVELNGIVYTGVLFAQPPTSTPGISKGSVTRTASMGGASSTSVAPPSAPPAPSSNSSSP